MSTDPAEPFYAAIRANPDDDLPRLVFADWLDENGQPDRAEYIRLSCAINREPEAERLKEWKTTAEELFRCHRMEWFGSLLKEFKQHNLDRGFITSIAGTPTQYFHFATEWDLFAPCLSKVGVGLTGMDAGTVLGLDFVQRITHLLFDSVAPASLDSLAAHVELPNLSELFIQTNGLNQLSEGIRFTDWCLARATNALRLSIGFGDIRGADPSRIQVSTTCTLLERHLDLSNLIAFRLWGVSDVVARALVRWPGLKQLAELNLHNCCVSEEALTVLMPALLNTRIEVLRLGNNSFSNSAIRHLVDTPYPSSLRELRLDRNRIGDSGVNELIASPHLRADLVLYIGNNTFSGRSAARLRERFPNVRF